MPIQKITDIIAQVQALEHKPAAAEPGRVSVNDTDGKFYDLLATIAESSGLSAIHIRNWINFVAKAMGYKVTNKGTLESPKFTFEPLSPGGKKVDAITSEDYTDFAQFLRSSLLLISAPETYPPAEGGAIETKEDEGASPLHSALAQRLHQSCFVSDSFMFSHANIICDSLNIYFGTAHRELHASFTQAVPKAKGANYAFAAKLLDEITAQWFVTTEAILSAGPPAPQLNITSPLKSPPPGADGSFLLASPGIDHTPIDMRLLTAPQVSCISNPLFIARLFEALALHISLVGEDYAKEDLEFFNHPLPKVKDSRTLHTLSIWLSFYDPSAGSIVGYLKSCVPADTPWLEPLTIENFFPVLENAITAAKLNEQPWSAIERHAGESPATPLQGMFAAHELFTNPAEPTADERTIATASAGAGGVGAIAVATPAPVTPAASTARRSVWERRGGTELRPLTTTHKKAEADKEAAAQLTYIQLARIMTFVNSTNVFLNAAHDKLTAKNWQILMRGVFAFYGIKLHTYHAGEAFRRENFEGLLDTAAPSSIYHPKLYLLLALHLNNLDILFNDAKFRMIVTKLQASISTYPDFIAFARLITEHCLIPEHLVTAGLITTEERASYLHLLRLDFLTSDTDFAEPLFYNTEQRKADAICHYANPKILGHFFAILEQIIGCGGLSADTAKAFIRQRFKAYYNDSPPAKPEAKAFIPKVFIPTPKPLIPNENLHELCFQEREVEGKLRIKRVKKAIPTAIMPSPDALKALFENFNITEMQFKNSITIGKDLDEALAPYLKDSFPDLDQRLSVIKAYLEFLRKNPDFALEAWNKYSPITIPPPAPAVDLDDTAGSADIERDAAAAGAGAPADAPPPIPSKDIGFTVRTVDDDDKDPAAPEATQRGLNLFLRILIRAVDAYRMQSADWISWRTLQTLGKFLLRYAPPGLTAAAVGYLIYRLITQPDGDDWKDKLDDYGAYAATGLLGLSLAENLLFSSEKIDKIIMAHVMMLLQHKIQDTYLGLLIAFFRLKSPALNFMTAQALPAAVTAGAFVAWNKFNNAANALNAETQTDDPTADRDQIIALTTWFIAMFMSGEMLLAFLKIAIVVWNIVPPLPCCRRDTAVVADAKASATGTQFSDIHTSSAAGMHPPIREADFLSNRAHRTKGGYGTAGGIPTPHTGRFGIITSPPAGAGAGDDARSYDGAQAAFQRTLAASGAPKAPKAPAGDNPRGRTRSG